MREVLRNCNGVAILAERRSSFAAREATRRDRRGTSISQARFTAPARYICVITDIWRGRADEIDWKLYAFKSMLFKSVG